MKNKYPLLIGTLITLLAIVLSACSTPTTSPVTAPSPLPAATATSQPTFSDPFAYCAAMGTIDTPDARYTGLAITDDIINGYISAAGLEATTEPMDMFKKTTTWRCMNGLVVACNFGANLPCSSKANIDKTPTSPMSDFCKANPDSAAIPMSVTGHSTIYSWHCVKDTAELLNQIENVDTAGYLAQIWYPISANASPRPESSATPIVGNGQILFASNRGGAYDDLYLLDIATAQVTRLTQGDSSTFPGPFSPDGTKVLFTGYGLTTSYVGVMSADGTHSLNLTVAQVDEGFASWSPDGSQILYTSRRDGNNEIYVMNADGTSQKRLTNAPKDDFASSGHLTGTRSPFFQIVIKRLAFTRST